MTLTFQARHNLVCLLCHLLVDIFALFVVAINVLGHRQRMAQVFLYQQVNTLLAVVHTS